LRSWTKTSGEWLGGETVKCHVKKSALYLNNKQLGGLFEEATEKDCMMGNKIKLIKIKSYF